MRVLFVPILSLLSSATPAFACSDSAHRALDFWQGEWLVRTGAAVVGENTVTSVAGGCALREEWRGRDGSTGTSLTFFDTARAQWHQTWIGGDGGALYLDGVFIAETLQLEGTRTLRDGKRATERIRWTPLPDGKVQQLWDRRLDGETEWRVVFDGLYERVSLPNKLSSDQRPPPNTTIVTNISPQK
jgi:hypothetical protein